MGRNPTLSGNAENHRTISMRVTTDFRDLCVWGAKELQFLSVSELLRNAVFNYLNRELGKKAVKDFFLNIYQRQAGADAMAIYDAQTAQIDAPTAQDNATPEMELG